jgi:predicted PurR-regulated permease PerM
MHDAAPDPALPSELDLDRPGNLAHQPTVPPEVDRVLWSEVTRRRALIGLFAASLVASLWLVWPYAYALLFGVTTVVVAQPVYRRVLARVRGRRHLAAGIATALLGMGVALPLSLVVMLAATEGAVIVEEVRRWSAEGGLQAAVDALMEGEAVQAAGVPLNLENALEDTVRNVVPNMGALATTVIGGAFAMLIDVLIYVATVVALFAEGPRALQAFMRILPLEDRHAARLVQVFHEMSYSVVVGNLATGVLQGGVAALGYLICGLPHVALLGVMSVIASFVPVVGTAVVWVPVALAVWVAWGWPAALFLAAWNILVTGMVDNIARPFFIKGSTNVPSVLLFVGLFGGIAWMGMPGLLVGPMIVAATLSLYTIYCQEVLGLPAPLEAKGDESLQAARRAVRRLRLRDTIDGWTFGR